MARLSINHAALIKGSCLLRRLETSFIINHFRGNFIQSYLMHGPAAGGRGQAVVLICMIILSN